MATYQDVLTAAAALMNDASKTEYTDTRQLPYLNIALADLEEIFELNNIPSTNETSAKLDVPANTSVIAFTGTTPTLPSTLKEIQELYCSQDGQNNWIRVDKKEFLTAYEPPTGSTRSFFGVWAWIEQEIRLIAANVALDIKIDFVQSIFPVITSGTLANTLTTVNAQSFLQYRVAALSAEFYAENQSRASSLNSNAMLALDRSLGISIKGKQSIIYRRQPFRASWKRRGIVI